MLCFDCPSHVAARGRFVLATKYIRDCDIESTASDLNHTVKYTKRNASWLEELAKVLLNIRMFRRREQRHFRFLGRNGRVTSYCADLAGK